ncbi:hypothetical protein C2845_PM04G33240 [Panicum miliaceum]|uniref:DUF6598 domain-containing protein n=1 Tax=Panicum miliaceum TaxID=4540 RepID=A0A3L6QNL0_PANMI|nr:hypothetical protein C2845_PM04G33240 [Panicum miliaceum]
MDLFMEILLLIKRKKMAELEEAYAKKQALTRAGEKGLQAHNKLRAHLGEHAPDYLRFRHDWTATNPELAFEDISEFFSSVSTYTSNSPFLFTGLLSNCRFRHANLIGLDPANPFVGIPAAKILAMIYTNLQIYSVKVAAATSQGCLQWPLHGFGLVAVHDSTDSKRNLIFNMQERDDCQTLTKEWDPYLVLTDPTCAVVMNEQSDPPVTIEAELKVKGTVESEDKYFIFAAGPLPPRSGSFELTGKHGKLEVTLGEIVSSVEATIFIRVADGTWPVGFHGQFAARTASITDKKVILVEFGGDGVPVRGDGIVEHFHHVVSVEASGELIVTFKAWKGNEEARRGEVVFKAKKSGRSFGTLRIGSCSLEVLVAWFCIRPMHV